MCGFAGHNDGPADGSSAGACCRAELGSRWPSERGVRTCVRACVQGVQLPCFFLAVFSSTAAFLGDARPPQATCS